MDDLEGTMLKETSHRTAVACFPTYAVYKIDPWKQGGEWWFPHLGQRDNSVPYMEVRSYLERG